MIEAIKAEIEATNARVEALQLAENIPEILLAAAREVPDQTALNFFEDGITLSYADLEARVRRLACALKGKGVEIGDRVGVMIANRPEFPTAWLAIAMIGAVMVPLNTRYTAREVRFVLKQAGAAILLIDDDLLVELTSAQPIAEVFAGRIVVNETGGVGREAAASYPRLADLAAAVGSDEAAALTCVADQWTLSNIQFTSGSTGMPKGCRQTHRFWIEVSCVMAKVYQPDAKNYLLHQSFFYMDPQFLMLAAFLNRGTAFVARRPSATRYFDWVNEHRIEFLFLPEFVYKQNSFEGKSFPSVKRGMIFGWGADNHRSAEKDLGFPLREGFGMTEIGMATFMPESAVTMVGSRSCGLPGPFRACKVMLDPDTEAADNEVGELWIKGPGVIEAYHDNPEANAKSFHDGWFRSGDLARRDEHGFYYYSGRLKDMIRRSGENISAQEVESILRTAPHLVEASVVAVKDLQRGEEVKAYVTLREDAGTALTAEIIEGIYATCEAGLAPFKWPRFLEVVPEFPRTGSNKIAKQTLVDMRAGLQRDHYDHATKSWVPVEF